MNRYVLAVTMLALGAGGVVWIAIKQRPPPTAAKAATKATAEPSASTTAASATPTDDAQVGDAGQAAAASGPLPGEEQTFPPLAADAAWSVVRWDMSAARVEVAFEEARVNVVEATDTKTGAKRLRVKSGLWEATIDFGARSPNQIVVTAESVSKEGADAVVAKMKARAPATKTIERTERRWKKDTGAVATLVVSVEGANATMREEHTREADPGGAIGFAGLRWGMSSQEVVGQLTGAKYVARVVKASASHAEAVPFTKGDVEGTASFNQFGLRQVEISGPTVDSGAARAKELDSWLGKAPSVEVSTKTQHVDPARMTSIEVEVIQRAAGGGFTVVETYHPKK